MQAKRQLETPSDFNAATSQAEENFAGRAQEIFFLTLHHEFEEYRDQHTIDGHLAVVVGALDDRLDSERLKRRLRGLRATFQALTDVATAQPARVGTTVGPEHQTPVEWAIERAEGTLHRDFPIGKNRRAVSDWLFGNPISEVTRLSKNDVGVYCVIARRLLAPFRGAVERELQIFADNLQSDRLSADADSSKGYALRAARKGSPVPSLRRVSEASSRFDETVGKWMYKAHQNLIHEGRKASRHRKTPNLTPAEYKNLVRRADAVRNGKPIFPPKEVLSRPVRDAVAKHNQRAGNSGKALTTWEKLAERAQFKRQIHARFNRAETFYRTHFVQEQS
jgi:hypothetical protein